MVRYFASLREQAALAEEVVDTEAADLRELWHELVVRHAFSLEVSLLRVAVDDEFQPMDAPLREGSCVVFIPPVAGG
jgi:molybdopterin synthase sulfur carrier subunit